MPAGRPPDAAPAWVIRSVAVRTRDGPERLDQAYRRLTDDPERLDQAYRRLTDDTPHDGPPPAPDRPPRRAGEAGAAVPRR
jgi:hypothetical protein